MVGKERRQAVGGRPVEVAGRAVRARGIVKERVAACFRRREARLAFEPAIELTRIRMKGLWLRFGSARRRKALRTATTCGCRKRRPRTAARSAARSARAAARPRRARRCRPFISCGLSSGPSAWLCSVFARPSQNRPPCGTRFCALATGPRHFSARERRLPAAESRVRRRSPHRPARREIRLAFEIHERRHARAPICRTSGGGPYARCVDCGTTRTTRLRTTTARGRKRRPAELRHRRERRRRRAHELHRMRIAAIARRRSIAATPAKIASRARGGARRFGPSVRAYVPRSRIEHQNRRVTAARSEVEHVHDRAGARVERTAAEPLRRAASCPR